MLCGILMMVRKHDIDFEQGACDCFVTLTENRRGCPTIVTGINKHVTLKICLTLYVICNNL